LPAKLVVRLMRLQQRLLNNVRRVELALQARVELQPGQQPQVVPMVLQPLSAGVGRLGHSRPLKVLT
jgi:hypothetical protein